MANPLRYPRELLKAVKKVLSLDDDDDQTEIPDFIFKALEAFLRTNPRDDNFVLECAENDDVVVDEDASFGSGSQEKKGGVGYGMVTCLENDCWNDIYLTPDPMQPDGGRAVGLGGFEMYKKHCREDRHIKARDVRLKKEERSAAKKAKDLVREITDAQAGSPRRLGKTNSLSQAMLAKSGVLSPARRKIGGAIAGTYNGKAVYAISSSDESDDGRIGQSKRAKLPGPKRTMTGRKQTVDIDLASSDSDANLKPSLRTLATVPNRKDKIKPIRRPLESDDDDVIMIEDVKPDIKPKIRLKKREPIVIEGKTRDVDYSKLSEKEKLLREANHLSNVYRDSSVSMKVAKSCDERGKYLLRLVEHPEEKYLPPSREILSHCPIILKLRPELPRLLVIADAEAAEAQRLSARAALLRDVKPDIKPHPVPSMPAAGPSRLPTNAQAGPSRHIAHQMRPDLNLGGMWAPAAPVPPKSNTQLMLDRIIAASTSLARLGGAAVGHVNDSLGALVNGDHYNSDNSDNEETARIGRLQAQHGTDMGNFFQDALSSFDAAQSVNDAAEYLGLASLNDKLPGMAVTLMPHQVLSVAFLLKREEDPRAGASLLLDSMGLGKTISCIATMVSHQSEDPTCKTTLIVAPLALLAQWKEEILTKTDGTMTVYTYHGQNKLTSAKALRKYDVILTTYGTLAGEWPKPEKKRKRKGPSAANGFIDDDDDDGEWAAANKRKEKAPGPLTRISFWRAVLDEAHIIRNKTTQAAKACFQIDAELRLVMTGTLIVNKVDDLFSQLHFTGLSNCCEWDEFRNHIQSPSTRNPKLAVKRMQAILRLVSLRRTKDSIIDGLPILTLPKKTIDVVEEDFTVEERDIYRTVETRAIVRFNRFLKAGTVMKNYSHVLLMLLRLRQCVLHPQLLTRKKGEAEGPEDYRIGAEDVLTEGYNRDRERAKAKAIGGDALVSKLEATLQRRADERVLAAADEEPTADDCPICSDAYTDEVLTVCCHSYCHDCLQEYCEHGGNTNDMDEGTAGARLRNAIGACPMCRADIKLSETFYAKAFEPNEVVGGADSEDDEMDDVKPRTKLKSKKHLFKSGALAGAESDSDGSQAAESNDEDEEYTKPSMGSRKKRFKHDPDDSDEDMKPDTKPRIGKGKGKAKKEDIDELEDDEDKELVPSTKMRAMLAQLEEWLGANPDDKILVFSQFTAFLNIVADYLDRNDIEHDMYVGSMSRQKREDTITYFKKRNSMRVLLVSLKCGGVGLNLTIANKVINLDLAWNAATEEQAVDRVHRIGQSKEVSVKRIVIRDSVEQRILALQEKKKAIADGALGEGGAGRLGRLNLQDLISLFTRSHHEPED